MKPTIRRLPNGRWQLTRAGYGFTPTHTITRDTFDAAVHELFDTAPARLYGSDGLFTMIRETGSRMVRSGRNNHPVVR